MTRRGRFCVLDGIDGCGKTTQAERLCAALEGDGGRAPLHLREPGGTAVGERLRDVLLDREHVLSAGVETLLFAASRRQMLEERVAPALADGRDVVCERFHPSTYAYQGGAGGLEAAEVLALLERWANEPAPDLVLVLDLPVELALSRRGPSRDRIEDKGDAFLGRVAAGYREYASRARNVVVVDASGDADEVHARVLEEVRRAG